MLNFLKDCFSLWPWPMRYQLQRVVQVRTKYRYHRMETSWWSKTTVSFKLKRLPWWCSTKVMYFRESDFTMELWKKRDGYQFSIVESFETEIRVLSLSPASAISSLSNQQSAVQDAAKSDGRRRGRNDIKLRHLWTTPSTRNCLGWMCLLPA